jgi:hypothetical protein
VVCVYVRVRASSYFLGAEPTEFQLVQLPTLEAHTLPSRVPSHSMSLSSDRNFIPPWDDAISQPKRSVTRCI